MTQRTNRLLTHWVAAREALKAGDQDAASAHLDQVKALLEPTAGMQYLNVPLPKGAILRLTTAEYQRAVARGKAWRRGQATAARLPERGTS